MSRQAELIDRSFEHDRPRKTWDTKEARKKAAATYNAAADSYDHPSNSFWDRYGRRTVGRLGLHQGARVLDVYCGSGASAIPAAEVVGRDGFVIGVDLAENLLELARLPRSPGRPAGAAAQHEVQQDGEKHRDHDAPQAAAFLEPDGQ